jgi:ethanolamine utilization protein EutQ (cupin superfamily)
MTDVAFLLGGQSNRSIIEQLMQDVVSFEQQVAQVRMSTYLITVFTGKTLI